MPNANQFGVKHPINRAGAQKASIITPFYQASMNAINISVRGIAQIEEITRVRVVACAAGLVTFPLFTQGPEAMRFIDLSKDEMLELQALAREMLAVTTYLNHSSKTVLESADVDEKWKVVERLSNPGRQGAATRSNKQRLTLACSRTLIDLEKGLGSNYT